MEGEIVEETSTIDVIGIIPAHMKNFNNISIDSVTPHELVVTIAGTQLKGKITDTVGTNMCFNLNGETSQAELVACADKQAKLEKLFYVPKEELEKPFLPSDSLKN